jgi:hypothetical protein
MSCSESDKETKCRGASAEGRTSCNHHPHAAPTQGRADWSKLPLSLGGLLSIGSPCCSHLGEAMGFDNLFYHASQGMGMVIRDCDFDVICGLELRGVCQHSS